MRYFFVVVFLLGWSFLFGSGSISISADSAMAVADGKSVVILTIVVRNSSGGLVADGTPVRVSSSHGYFREGEVSTGNGVARAELVAPTTEGVAVVTVSVPTIGTIQTFEFEFVKDRSMLVASHQYVDIESREYLVFHAGIQVVSATGRYTPARLKYRDIVVTARDMQFDSVRMQLVARRATLTVGNKSIECANLKYSLNRRKGTAIATVDGRMGFYELTAAEPHLSESPAPPREFEFADVGVSTQSVHADRIVIFPNREVQFYRARMYVGNTRVMNVPMYAMRPSSETTILGDEIISYNNGGVLLNYPYYLTMSPEYTSVLRFRSGYDGGRGSASSRGVFVDWENKYLAGEDGQGVVTLAGIGRNDMGLSWRHSHRFGERTTANASLDFPAFKTIYGSLNSSTAFDGFSLNIVGASSRTLRGTPFETRRFDVSLETDRKQVGGLPMTYSLGITANSYFAEIAGNTTKQEGVGWRGSLVYLPVKLWDGASLTGSTTVTQLWNNRASGRLGVLNTVSMTTPIGTEGALQLSYDFVHNAFGRSLFGKHRVTGNLSWSSKRFDVNLFGGKSLDFDSLTLFLDGSYSLSDKWRFGASFSLDRYLGESIIDQTFIIGYTLGTREIGVTYNAHSGKFGLTLLNARFR